MVNFDAGWDISGKSNRKYYTNTRGYIGSGYIGKNVYFESLFAENQSFFPTYLSKSNNATKIIPGQGRWKTFKDIGYDYAFSSGFVSVQVHKNVNIQAGHGKQKIGHGYRSLLLSDNSFNYPFIRITHQWFGGGMGLAFADGPTDVHKSQLARAYLKKASASDGMFPSEHIPTRTAAALKRYPGARG